MGDVDLGDIHKKNTCFMDSLSSFWPHFLYGNKKTFGLCLL